MMLVFLLSAFVSNTSTGSCGVLGQSWLLTTASCDSQAMADGRLAPSELGRGVSESTILKAAAPLSKQRK